MPFNQKTSKVNVIEPESSGTNAVEPEKQLP